jgi:hypothetical protein
MMSYPFFKGGHVPAAVLAARGGAGGECPLGATDTLSRTRSPFSLSRCPLSPQLLSQIINTQSLF